MGFKYPGYVSTVLLALGLLVVLAPPCFRRVQADAGRGFTRVQALRAPCSHAATQPCSYASFVFRLCMRSAQARLNVAHDPIKTHNA